MKKILKFLKIKLMYNSSVLEDILIGLAIILAGYFYYYENKKIVYNIENTQSVNYAIKIAIGIIIILVWVFLSFQNGIKRKNSFLVSTLCVWIIPQIIKYCIDTFDNGVYSFSLQKSFLTLMKYFSGINYLSLKTFGDMIFDYTNISYIITLNIIIVLFVIMFSIGSVLSKYFDNADEIDEKYSKPADDSSQVRI